MSESPSPVPTPAHSESRVRHERRDVNARIIMYIGLGACVCAVLIHFGLLELFHIYRVQEDRGDPLPPPLRTAESQLPPPPRLEVKPGASLQELRRAEQARLSSYRWVDRQTQEVRIPIDRAMELSLERGLPDWQEKSGAKEKAQQQKEPEPKP